MPFDQKFIASEIANLHGLGVSRSDATLASDVAQHAVDEAMQTLLRVVSTIPDNDTRLIGTMLAVVWLQEASREARAQLSEALSKALGLPL